MSRCYINPINDSKYWVNSKGERHRVGGPAIERVDGTKEWYQNDLPHREDGPAIEWVDGTKVWYQNGIYHREDGPAMELSSGVKAWYINGKHIT